MGGHMDASKTYNIAKKFYYWPGMLDWICALIADRLNCQNNKAKPKHRNEVPLEEGQNETVPFRTIHIDHKGPLHPPSNRNIHCLLVTDAFSRFLMVYPVTNSGNSFCCRQMDPFVWNSPIYCARSRHCFY